MASGRREHTTELIRAAARDEFVEVGPRALSLNSVSKRAFVSVGSVYERWSDKDTCVVDTVHAYLPPAVEELSRPWLTQDVPLSRASVDPLTSEQGLQTLRLVAECVFAARDDEILVAFVDEQLGSLTGAITSRALAERANGGTAWWIVSTWLGYSLLHTSGSRIPATFTDTMARMVAGIGTYVASAPQADAAVAVPTSGATASSPDASKDETAAALVDAARQVIAEQGIDEADTRTIAGQAGLTTGAIYRRFQGRSQILTQALLMELPPERYAWTEPFTAALAAKGLEGAGDFLAGLTKRIWEDAMSARMLLEFTVLAHTDTTVLAAILSEIDKVARDRTELFHNLITAGIIRQDLDPEVLAWMLQIPPIGMRLLASIGIIPDDRDLALLMRAYLLYLTDTSA